MEERLLEVLSNYDIDGEITDVKSFGNGHINRTYYVDAAKPYLMQKINNVVFPDPDKLMDNFVAVTEYLKKIIAAEGGDPMTGTLTVIKTKDGKNYTITESGEYYRLLYFVNGVSIEMTETDEQLFSVAAAFGKFQNDLADYDASTLYEVIPKFHDTLKRFADLEQAIAENKAGRLSEVTAEIEYARSMKDRIGVIVNGIKDGSVPLRVTHNDTKLNNVLFDEKLEKCICVIDLDTVMPGSYLYDYGDALRFAGSSAAEDEKDLSKIYFDMKKFEAFTAGYLSKVKTVLTPKEKELLPFSAELMTYECGIRFLADYLNGDTYFKIGYPEHNLVRARSQFKLAQDIDSKLGEMAKIVEKYSK
ncbi:MAG: phosphotransferase [Clostridiales bacterium]|nr:phosphotransferase [Candidatus Equinaster intestinalis]